MGVQDDIVLTSDINIDYNKETKNVLTQVVAKKTRIIFDSTTLIAYIGTDDQLLQRNAHLTPRITHRYILTIQTNRSLNFTDYTVKIWKRIGLFNFKTRVYR